MPPFGASATTWTRPSRMAGATAAWTDQIPPRALAGPGGTDGQQVGVQQPQPPGQPVLTDRDGQRGQVDVATPVHGRERGHRIAERVALKEPQDDGSEHAVPGSLPRAR